MAGYWVGEMECQKADGKAVKKAVQWEDWMVDEKAV